MSKYIILLGVVSTILILSCENNDTGLESECSFYTPFNNSNILYIGMSKEEVEKEFSNLSFVNRDYLDEYLTDKVYIAFTQSKINDINKKAYHQFNFENDSLFYYTCFFLITGLQFDTMISHYPLRLKEADIPNSFIQDSFEYNDTICNFQYNVYKSLYDDRSYYIENEYVNDLDTIFEVVVSAVSRNE